MSLPTVPEAPVIDTQRTFAYDQIFLCWRLPPHSPPAWHYTVEFRRTDVPAQPGPTRWQRREEVRGTSALLENPDTGSVYVLRVRGCNKAGYGEYSEDVHLHTPPAPGKYTDRWLHVVNTGVHAEGTDTQLIPSGHWKSATHLASGLIIKPLYYGTRKARCGGTHL